MKSPCGDWNGGQGNDEFNAPNGLAFDTAGRLYVSDTYNHRIQVFQPDGTYLATIGVTGQAGADNAHFNEPRHIIIDSNGRLYVADSLNHRIQILDVAGFPAVNYIATIGASGVSGSDNAHLNTPSGVAVDISRGRIYVSDGYNWRVQMFDYATRAWQATLADSSYTDDVAVDASGNLYISKPWGGQHIVKQFDSSLNFIKNYGSAGVPYLTDTHHYYQPSGVAIAMDGSMYISETYGRRLTKLNAGGTAQWSIGTPGNWGGDNSEFSYARAVDLDSQGRVYVVDEANCRVQVYNSDGSYRATLGAGGDYCGTGSDQFGRPRGVAIGPGDMIYVADSDNHRVQVFDSNRNYIATIGQAGVSGSDNGHFNYPIDVDVDAGGNIYVVDHNNHRVQVFNSSRVYVRTIGESGVAVDDFGHLRNPTAVVVGSDGRTFVASSWGDRIHVYDSAGAYLTTIGGSYGERTGQLRDASGLALDTAGNLYIAEAENHRVQKFAPGVPGWRQVNINGFGDRSNRYISSLAPFGNQLYAGTYNTGGNGTQLWRMGATGTWNSVSPNGFGDVSNRAIDRMIEFKGNLYAGTENGTNGGQIWRTPDGDNWMRVVDQGFGDPTNGEVLGLGVFKDMLYATTWSYTNTHGSEIWRSTTGNSGDWHRVVANGFGDSTNQVIGGLVEYDGYLYAGTYHYPVGAEVWRTPDGATWNQVNTDGFGDPTNYAALMLAVFDGQLYVSTHRTSAVDGGQIWRCASCDDSDWQQVVSGGFGDKRNWAIDSLIAFGTWLYAATGNWTTGTEVWRTQNGADWSQANPDGFGDSNSGGTWWAGSSVAAFNNQLVIGTDGASGAKVWMKSLTADFTAAPMRGVPPLTVQFTNTSAGDFTSSQWDFGDGATSTETNPTHTYTVQGAYAVTLTIGDGTDTSTITKPAYIVAKHFTYLPLVLRNYDPLLYDDFNDATWDGAWNPAKWHAWDTTGFDVRQENGAMVFSNPSPTDKTTTLDLQRWGKHSLGQLRLFEARLKISSDRSGGGSAIWIHFQTPAVGYDDWYTECGLEGRPGDAAIAHCQIAQSQGDNWNDEYQTLGMQVNYDTWYTLRIETDPATANMRFFLDNTLLGSHTPKDAAALLSTSTLSARLAALNFDQGGRSTRYVDDVRITPAQ
jgi:PKD repeat protein